MAKKNELNIVNLFLCLAVIFIHAAGAVVSGPKNTVGFYTLFPLWNLASAAVPGFIFISGLKFALSRDCREELHYGKFVAKKLRTIYLPYVLWVVAYYFYFLWRGYYSFSVKDLIGYILLGNLAAHFYFVVIIMQLYLLAPVWKKALQKLHPVLLLLLALFITLISGQYLPSLLSMISKGKIEFLWNDRIFTSYLYYYVLGLVAGKYYDRFLEMLRKNKGVLIGFAAVFAVLFCLCYGAVFAAGQPAPWYENFKLGYCTLCICVLMILALSHSESKWFTGNAFSALNQATYLVYLAHLIFMQEIDRILQLTGLYDRLAVAFVIRLIAVTVISFCVCTAYKAVRRRAGQIRK